MAFCPPALPACGPAPLPAFLYVPVRPPARPPAWQPASSPSPTTAHLPPATAHARFALQNSSGETRDRSRQLAHQVGSHHLDVRIDSLVAAMTALFSAITGRMPRFRWVTARRAMNTHAELQPPVLNCHAGLPCWTAMLGNGGSSSIHLHSVFSLPSQPSPSYLSLAHIPPPAHLLVCLPAWWRRVHGGSAAENLALQNIQARLRMVLAFLLAQASTLPPPLLPPQLQPQSLHPQLQLQPQSQHQPSCGVQSQSSFADGAGCLIPALCPCPPAAADAVGAWPQRFPAGAGIR